MRRSQKKWTAMFLIWLLLFSGMTNTWPVISEAAETGITVDGSKEDWKETQSLSSSAAAGYEGFQLGDVYLKNDSQYLYYWVDAKNIPNWGDNGMYLNLALNVNDIDSKVEENPWGAPFHFGGMDEKPQFHIVSRIKNDNEMNGAALYSSSDLSIPILSTWDGAKAAEFAVDRTQGFEGKIPLSELGLKNDDTLKAIAVLSGNNAAEHGAFDVSPEADGNATAKSWNEKDNPNVQSAYSSEYKVSGIDQAAKLNLISSSPANGEKNVKTASPITLTYNESVQLAQPDLIELKDSEGQAVKSEIKANGTQVTVKPEALQTAKSYILSVPKQAILGEVSKTSLDKDLSVSFETNSESLYTFKINYFRFDGKQNEWDMWIWEDGKDGKEYDFNGTADGFASASQEFSSSKINIITRPGSWAGQEMQRTISVPDGKKEVEAWIVEGVETVYYSKEEANISERVQAAMMDSADTITVTTTHPVEDSEIDTFRVTNNESKKELKANVKKVRDNQVLLTIENPEDVDVTKPYEVRSDHFAPAQVTMRKILDDKKYYYNGKDLGLTYQSSKSTFKLWAPTAEKVSVALFDDAGTYNEAGLVEDHTNGSEREMDRSDNGVWSKEITGDLNGQFYMFKVEFADGKINYVADPYSVAVSANGQRSAILSLDKTDPVNWSQSSKPVHIEPTDAILYELHVRDFSIAENSGMKNKGKFKAFTETGTTDNNGNSTGIDHLKDLGVTHVHLLPSYDFKTVNELTVDDPNSKNPKFNWGYDPQNYNVPEGSYSTDPQDPAVRVKEFKEMVQSMHDQGIRVVMDVVYNHTFDVPNGPFDKIVPGYYYRTTDTGKLANGSGVGNEIASERPMVRKYIKDSVRYWAEEYNVDGFRFDLMGLIDTPTMEQITKELHEQVDPSILVYGEPWQAGGSPLPENQQTVKGSQKDKHFAVFNDNLRGAIKGGSDDASKGFATGETGKEADLLKGVYGAINDFTNSPTETINYVTAHDNLNMWDKVIKTQGLEEQEGFVEIKDGILQGEDAVKYSSVEEAVAAASPHHAVDKNYVMENETVKRSLLANGIALTSQGIPFIHAGDELLRTKFGDHNSYKSPDAINQIRWADKKEYEEVFDYYKGLIEMRKTHPAFRMSTKEAAEKNIEVFKQDGNIVAYKLKNHANGDSWNNIVVIYNGNNEAKKVTLPDDVKWNVAVDHKDAGTKSLRTIDKAEAEVQPLSMMVLFDEEKTYTPVVESIDVTPKELGLEPGSTRVIRAIAKDQNGNPSIEKIVWSAKNDKIATVNQAGKITALKKGKTEITAAIGDVKATIHVTVADLIPSSITLTGAESIFEGFTSQMTALVKDQFGQSISQADVKWNTSDASVASVNSNGEVRALKQGKATITAQAGDVKAQLELTVKKYEKRYIQFTYSREGNDYTDWNIWTWQTGLEDGEKRFTKENDKGAISTFEIGPDASRIGFVLRKGQDWAEKDPYDQDRYIEADPFQTFTKVFVESGKGEFHTVPAVKGPVISDGKATFFYRDQELFENNAMHTIEAVKLRIDGNLYDMEYDEKNEYFKHTFDIPKEGKYEYTYLVTKVGVTTEVKDPYFEKSFIEYIVPKVKMDASVYPNEIQSNQNAVLSLKITSEREGIKFTSLYADASSIGGSKELQIDPQLNEITLSVKDSVTAGEKEIPVTAVDEFGNKHTTTAKVTVKTRVSSDEGDFDWDEARIYFMLTDRFFDGDTSNNDPNDENYNQKHPETYHGGDFKGITNKLDYLEGLGINTIWITPILDNIDWDLRHNKDGNQYGYHGYWAKDFTKIDEHLGEIKDFNELIDKAHERNIKVMVDVVLNHTGYGLKENDANNDGIPNFPTDEDRSRFKGMLRDGGTDVIKGELAGLPDLKTEDPEVRKKIIEWQTKWAAHKTDTGQSIDYFRVDTVKHVEETTWKAFKNELTKVNPNFKMIGEYYGAGIDNTGGYLNSGQMDSLLDFNFKYDARDFINGNIDEVEARLESRNDKLSNTATMGQFLSSHDEDGFLMAHAGNDLSKQKIAASLQITAKGQPVIYYGEELGQTGKHAGDMDKGEFNENRYNLNWADTDNNDLLVHYQKLLNIRKDFSKVFSKGTREKTAGSNEDGYLVFSREYNDHAVLVGINTTEEKQQVILDVPFEKSDKVIDLYSGKEYNVSNEQQVTVDLPGRKQGGTFILALENDSVTPPGGEVPGDGNGGDPADNDGGNPEGTDSGTDDPGSENPDYNMNPASDNRNGRDSSSTENSLPDTAMNSYSILLIGLAIGALGIVWYRRLRTKT
ncbi:type I pullulanase [Bacillus sp. UMB0893]|uniref:type I pullulanase n=1 Tax=Bacillus sp. UMB0893 TaxID=2066053 RepID=UPI000C78880F|nr:type I pullulanase [Bacillus sp. UMB0893]PLR66776.1 type I pullulanase [Bacillus sp. UMB0893]